jgi:hypothetical protein
MTLRHALVAALLLAAVAAPAGAASTRARPAARHTRSVARRAAAGAPPGRAIAAGRSGEGVRRLEDIHIEGEIPVPQVLFITARDQRRFLEFQHGRYLKTSRTMGDETPLPAWIVVTGIRPAEDKGSSR